MYDQDELEFMVFNCNEEALATIWKRDLDYKNAINDRYIYCLVNGCFELRNKTDGSVLCLKHNKILDDYYSKDEDWFIFTLFMWDANG